MAGGKNQMSIQIDNREDASELLKLLREAQDLTRSRRIYLSASALITVLESQLTDANYALFILYPTTATPETEQ